MIPRALIAVAVVTALVAAAFLLIPRPEGVEPPADEPVDAPGPEVAPPPAVPDPDEADAPAPPAGEEAPPVVLLVRCEDGSPVAHANVVRFSEGSLVDQRSTDDRGRATFTPEKAADKVVVRSAGHLPVSATYAPVEGRQVIVLPDGEEISGRVLVDGAPLREELVIELDLDGDPPRHANAVTDDAGRFRCLGVPKEWTGALVAPRGYAFTDPASDGSRLPLTGPARNLEVHLHRFPAITGRVVREPGGPGVGNALVRVHWTGERGEGTEAFRTDFEGSFRAHVPSDRVRTLALSAQRHWGLGAVRIEIPVSGLPADVDVGEVALSPTRTLEVRLRDRTGEPVVGAVVRAGDARARPDAEGRTSITVKPGDRTLLAIALGYRVAEAPVPLTGGAELVLDRSPVLTIRALTPAGAIARRVDVEIVCDGRVIGGPEGEEPGLSAAAGAGSGRPYAGGPGHYELHYRPRGGGAFLLSGFAEGAKVRLRAFDLLLPEPLHESWVEITADAHQTLDLEVPAADGAIEGKVVDEAGAPVAGARAGIFVDPSRSLYAWSDAEGRFRLDGLRVDRAHVLVEKEGKAPELAEDVPVPGKPLEFTLLEGREVVVRVVDRKGRAVSGARVQDGRPDGEGGLRIDGLPPGKVTLVALVGGVEYPVEHDTREPEATITVPVHGAARARWSFALERDVPHRLRLVPTGEEGAEVAVRVGSDPGRDGHGVLVPAALPGRYRARIEIWDRAAGAWAPWIEGPTVTVRPDETTEIPISR